MQPAISQFSVQQLREFSEIFKTPLDGCFCRLLCWVHWRWITKKSVTSFGSFKILSRSKKSFGINVNLESILITTQVFLVQMWTCYFLLGTQHAICQAACCTLFFSKNKIILAEAHYSYFLVDFRLIWSYFALATTVNKQKGDNRWRKEVHIFGAKVLNFLELAGIIHFFHIYRIHVLLSIFSFIDGVSRIINLNLILVVLNLFCCKVLCIYLFKHFYFKKLSYCHQYSF